VPDGLTPFGVALVVENLPQYEQAARRVTEVTERMSDAAEQAAERARQSQRDWGKAALAMGSLGGLLTNIARNWVMVAARAEELDAVLRLVGRSAGYTSEYIAEQREILRDLGIEYTSAQTILLRLIQSNIDLANATKIANAARDLAVIGFRDTSASAMDMAYAISTGNMIILRKYGILTTLQSALRKLNMSSKTRINMLTGEARAQLVLNAITEFAARVQGAYTIAMSTASKQLRSFARYTKELARVLGEPLLPAFTKVVFTAAEMIKLIRQLPPEILRLISYATAASGAMFSVAAGIALWNWKLRSIFQQFLLLPQLLARFPFILLKFLISPMGLATTALATFAAAVIFDWGDMQKHIVATVQRIQEAVRYLIVVFQELGSAIRGGLMTARITLESIRSSVEFASSGMAAAFEGGARRVLRTGQDLTAEDFGIKFDPFRFAEGAARLMAGFAVGLLHGLNTYVIPTLTSVVQAVADFLIGRSPPPVGPLSDIITGGAEVIRSWLLGMKSASLAEMASIAQRVKDALERPLFEASEAIRELKLELRDLDDALKPLELSLRRAEASASLVTIPLRQQLIMMEEQLELLEERERLEEEAAQARLSALEEELGLLNATIEADEARLKHLELQIRLERDRLTKAGKFDSERLRSLYAEKRAIQEGLVAQAERRAETEESVEVAKAALEEAKATQSAELTALQEQQAALQERIRAEERVVELMRLDLEYAQALQVEERIGLEQQLEAWERRQEELNYYGSLADKVLSKVKKGQEALSKALEEAAKETGQGIDDAAKKFDKLAGLIAVLRERLKGIFAPVRVEAEKLGYSLAGLEVAWHNLTDAFLEFFGLKPPKWFDETLGGYMGLAGGVPPAAAPPAPPWEEKVIELFRRLGQKAGQVLREELWKWIVGEEVTGAGGVGPAIPPGGEAYWRTLGQKAGQKLWEGIMDLFRGPPPGAEKDWLGPALHPSVEIWETETGRKLDAGFGGIVESIVAPELEKLKTEFAKTFQFLDLKLAEWIYGAQADYSWYFQWEHKAWVQRLDGNETQQLGFFQRTSDALVNWFNQRGLQLEQSLGFEFLSWETYRSQQEEGQGSFLGYLYAIEDQFWTDLLGLVKKKLGELKEKFVTKWNEIKTTVSTKLSEIYEDVKAWASKVLAYLGDPEGFLNDMVEMGKTIFQSLWDGLKEKEGKILSWIKGLAGSWIRSIKSKFKIIGDPYSRAFQGIGEALGQGLEMGLTAGMAEAEEALDFAMQFSELFERSLMLGLDRALRQFVPAFQEQVEAVVAMLPQTIVVPQVAGPSPMVKQVQITKYGPTVNLTAHYATSQSVASIKDDVGLMLSLAGV